MNDVTSFLVYGLVDPLEENEIFYVGETRKNLLQRLGEHIAEAGEGSLRPVHEYIRELAYFGSTPGIILLATSDSKRGAQKLEQTFIQKIGVERLTNLYAGPRRIDLYLDPQEGKSPSNKGTKLSSEIKKRMSESSKGFKHSDGAKQIIAEKLCGNTHTLGKTRPERAKKRTSDFMVKWWRSPEGLAEKERRKREVEERATRKMTRSDV